MPTFTHGKNAKVLMDGADLSAYFSKVSNKGSAETAEVTTLGANAKAYIPGLKDATISVDGYWSGDVAGVDSYLASNIGSTGIWTVIYAADALGARGYGATVVDTSIEVGAEIGGAVSISAEGQATVGSEPVVVLNPLSAKTATGTGTQVDNTTSTSNGSASYLHVTATSGTSTPSLAVKVQHSADASTWADLAVFTTVTTANTAQRVASTGTVNRYLRAQFTITGTTPSFTFHLSTARL
jgi:hypothetical protein